MIREMHMRVKPQNNYARIAFFVFFFLTFAVFGISYALEFYRGLLQLGAMCCLVTAILLYTKFIAPIYQYDILLDVNDVPVFTVCQTTGRRMTTLCRVELADIRTADILTREQRKAQKADPSVRHYVYTPSLFPATVCVVRVEGRHERAQLVLEGTQEFASFLLEQAELARQICHTTEETDE